MPYILRIILVVNLNFSLNVSFLNIILKESSYYFQKVPLISAIGLNIYYEVFRKDIKSSPILSLKDFKIVIGFPLLEFPLISIQTTYASFLFTIIFSKSKFSCLDFHLILLIASSLSSNKLSLELLSSLPSFFLILDLNILNVCFSDYLPLFLLDRLSNYEVLQEVDFC